MTKHGALAAIGAYTIWGLAPVYWKAVQRIPAQEALGHRVLWSFMLIVLLLLWKRRWKWLRQVGQSRVTLVTFAVTAALLAVNWFVYVWAVNHDRMVDASLGYFINPLINVLLGMLFLRERLRPWQWVAVGTAATGVTWLALGHGALPWVALTLAFSFGIYGLLRKTASLGPLEGLTLEMATLFLPALVYLVYLALTGASSVGQVETTTSLLLPFSAFVTVTPLLLFSFGARRITLATIGILQYIAPTSQLLLSVLVYGEPFTQTSMVGFGLIWTALLIYSLEGALEGRKRQASAFSTS